MLPLFLAHGLGGRSDLPIPLGLAVRAAGAAVFISFIALAFLWPEPRLRGAEAGRPLPAVLQRVVDSAVTRTVLRVVALALALFVIVVGLAGPDATNSNIAPWLFHITFWVGLIPASLLFGAFWRYVNPLRLLHGGIARVSGSEPGEGLRPYPERLGYWPAAVSLAAFVWLELVAPARDEPYVVASFIAVYGLLHFIAGSVYGDTWFARGDGFEVYSSFIGRLSPFGRRSDGRLVVRNPLNGIDSVTPRAGLVAVVSVLIGSTAFDGLTRTRIWKDNVEATSIRSARSACSAASSSSRRPTSSRRGSPHAPAVTCRPATIPARSPRRLSRSRSGTPSRTTSRSSCWRASARCSWPATRSRPAPTSSAWPAAGSTTRWCRRTPSPTRRSARSSLGTSSA
jgi:hypothetical protein